MTEKDPGENFEEFGRLPSILRAADHSGKSKVRDSLKERLLNRAAQEEKKILPKWNWLFPVAATALAALAVAVLAPHKQVVIPVAYSSAYDVPADNYGDCGRQGLKDYLAGPRF